MQFIPRFGAGFARLPPGGLVAGASLQLRCDLAEDNGQPHAASVVTCLATRPDGVGLSLAATATNAGNSSWDVGQVQFSQSDVWSITWVADGVASPPTIILVGTTATPVSPQVPASPLLVTQDLSPIVSQSAAVLTVQRVTALPTAGTLDGTEAVLAVQGGAARQATVAQLAGAAAALVTPGAIGAATTGALTAETTARTSGDAANAAALTTEATARAAGDAANADAISTETAARISGDAANAAAQATEATARAAGDATNADAISTETAARISGDAANAAALTTEATARAAGDAATLSAANAAAPGLAPVQSVAGRTGAVTLALADISGLGGAAALSVGTAAGTVAAGDDSRLVANGAVVSTNGTGIRWQMITTAGQILTRFRDSVAAAASGVAGAWAGLEVAVGIKAPVVNATQSVTVNAEAVTGGSDGKSAVIWADGAGRIIARLLLTGVLDVPALLVRGAATFASTAGITVAKLITGSEAVQSTTRSTSLMTVEDGNGRVVARVRNTGVVEVPALKASGYIVAPAVYPRDPVTVTQVGVSNAAVTALNANLPTMPTGLPPSPTFSKSVATYGLATRHASESMGIAVTGRRVWCAFYGQNSVTGSGPGTTTAETDGAYVVLAYCDNYPTGTWTECLYILPTAYTGSGGAGVGRCIDPVLYTAPDGRLLVMWKSTGISNVTDTTITNTAVMAFLIQNPQAAAGVFVVGRMQYLGVGRPEAPGVLGSDVYMLNDQASGTITWGKLTTSGADSLTYTVLNTLPAFSSPASIGLECSWAPLSSGEVIALFRTSNGLYTVTSTAGVSGWGSPVQWTAYANPTNGTPNGARAVITRSPYSGRLMIVFNNHATQRYNMSATFSSDDAATWPTIMLIDPRNSAYPAVAFDATGRPMIATDHNRGALTQEMDVWRIDEDAIFAGSPLIEKSIAALGVV